jgi:hypothetical protein
MIDRRVFSLGSLSLPGALQRGAVRTEMLFIRGGTRGTVALMKDPEVLDFPADRGSRARHVGGFSSRGGGRAKRWMV